METRMHNKALTIFGALLISGLAVQVAPASEHQGHKAHYGRTYDRPEFRRAYNQWIGPIDVVPRALDRSETDGFGVNGNDPSWVGGKDPSFNPAGN